MCCAATSNGTLPIREQNQWFTWPLESKDAECIPGNTPTPASRTSDIRNLGRTGADVHTTTKSHIWLLPIAHKTPTKSRNHGTFPFCSNIPSRILPTWGVGRRPVKRHRYSQHDRPGNSKVAPKGNTRPRKGTRISHQHRTRRTKSISHTSQEYNRPINGINSRKIGASPSHL